MLWFLTILLAGFFLWGAWRFYQSVDWDEPAESSPDFHAMHKKEAELMHVEDVLAQVHAEGGISQQAVDEFRRYAENQQKAMRDAEHQWKLRRRRLTVQK